MSVCILMRANWKWVVPASSQGGANPRIHNLYTSKAELWALCCPCQSRLAEGNSAGSFLILYSSSLTNPVLNKMSFQISTNTVINLQNKPEWSSPKFRAEKSFNFCTDRRALLLALAQINHSGFMVILQFLTFSPGLVFSKISAWMKQDCLSWNRGMVWVGGDLKAHLIATPLLRAGTEINLRRRNNSPVLQAIFRLWEKIRIISYPLIRSKTYY